MSGVTRQSYAPEIRIIRLMCTGRVDLAFILRAFSSGADGVIIGGCWPGECHYVTEGNYDALGNVHLAKKLLELIGISTDRVRLEWIAASEGTRFAEVMSEFAGTLRETYWAVFVSGLIIMGLENYLIRTWASEEIRKEERKRERGV